VTCLKAIWEEEFKEWNKRSLRAKQYMYLSPFTTERLRAKRTPGSGSRTACLTMVYKLMESAS